MVMEGRGPGVLARGDSGQVERVDLDEVAALMVAYWPGGAREAPSGVAMAEALVEALRQWARVR